MKNLKKLFNDGNNPIQINDIYFYGSVLKSLREKSNLNQVEISEKTGFKQSYISNVERGIKNPSSSFLEAFAKELNIEIEDLIIAIIRDYQKFIDYQKEKAKEEIKRLEKRVERLDKELTSELNHSKKDLNSKFTTNHRKSNRYVAS